MPNRQWTSIAGAVALAAGIALPAHATPFFFSTGNPDGLMGYRYRLHRRSLPGTPDLVFPKLRKAIFVHGCFWHRHQGCRRTTTPKTRAAFWADKFQRNIERDALKESALKALGWEVLVVWECETFDPVTLARRLDAFLVKPHPNPPTR